MADFLLVHGSCHGAWCWRDLIPALETRGHSVRAIDMPSHGSDPTSIDQVTLDSCRNAVLAASRSDTIIVGHSWGGYPISAAAELRPDAMRGLIFLSAYVPENGLSMVEMRRKSPRQTIVDAVEKSTDGLSYTVKPDSVKALFYHDCPEEVLLYALARLCPQAIAPQEARLTLTAHFQDMPKAYIRTLDDHTIPPEYQHIMSLSMPEGMRHSIQSSHSPFFSHPEKLADLLDDIAQGFDTLD